MIKGRVIGSAVGVALVAGLGWVVGLDWLHAALFAMAIVVTFGLRKMPAVNPDHSWPQRADDRRDHGTRREASRLSWSLQGYESRVERSSVRRLRDIARTRLAERGLELEEPTDEPACRALLGDLPYRLLTADPFNRPPYADFIRTLDAVENLTRAER